MRTPDDLHGYQNDAVAFAMATPRCALYMGLGLGKTIVALTVAAYEHALGGASRTLIIAPLRVANTVWAAEARRWSHTRFLKFAIATGTAANRLAALRSNADVMVINVENVQWLVKNFPRTKWRWDNVIVDEASGFKAPGSKRSVYLRAATNSRKRTIRGVTQKIKSKVRRIMLLSATPATRGLEGLWSQIAILDGGYRLGRSFDAFSLQYFFVKPGMHNRNKLIPFAGAKERIFNRVKGITYVLQTEDHLDMPDLIYNDITVELTGKVRKQYKTLEREFLLELPELDEEIIANNTGSLSNKLLQFCNGAVYTGETPEVATRNRKWAEIHELKIDALGDLVVAAEGNENLLVAYWYQSDLMRLREAFPQGVTMDRQGDAIKPWNQGKIPLMFLHPQGGGHGLNLQDGGATAVWFSMVWSLELYQQFIGRIYRQGQQRGVTINHIVCADTVEQQVARLLRSHAQTQQEFFDALKRGPSILRAA